MNKHTHTEWMREGNTVYALNLEGSNRFVAQVQGGWATHSRVRTDEFELEANARLIAAAPSLLAELQRAQEFIDIIRQELHQRRVADWYPEGAHNAADQMSEDMRLLGNACADFDTSAVITKATGESA